MIRRSIWSSKHNLPLKQNKISKVATVLGFGRQGPAIVLEILAQAVTEHGTARIDLKVCFKFLWQQCSERIENHIVSHVMLVLSTIILFVRSMSARRMVLEKYNSRAIDVGSLQTDGA